MPNEEINYDLMSDEEFAKQALPPLEEVAETENADTDSVETEATEDKEVEDTTEISDKESIEEVGQEDTNEAEESGETKELEAAETEEEEDEEDKESSEESTKELTIEDLLKEPLKVNGHDIQLNSADELLKLAKRGIGSSKRMQDLAPKLKVINMLEANNLLEDTEQLNLLIAASKNDKEAINKLVQKAKIDPLDLSTEESDYKPDDYSVSDSEVAINQVIDEISHTDTFDDTIASIKALDDASKAEISGNPKLLQVINQHHADGTYKQVQAIVTKERALGNLPGLNDIKAYEHVISVIQENLAGTGGAQEAGHKSNNNGQNSGEDLAGKNGDSEAGHNTSGVKQVSNNQKAAAKAAKATNKNRGDAKATATINFDELSDEEFMKLNESDFLK